MDVPSGRTGFPTLAAEEVSASSPLNAESFIVSQST